MTRFVCFRTNTRDNKIVTLVVWASGWGVGVNFKDSGVIRPCLCFGCGLHSGVTSWAGLRVRRADPHQRSFQPLALHAASLGMVFHFVSLTELFSQGKSYGRRFITGSPCWRFSRWVFFMVIYTIYKTTSPGVVVFPVAFS